MTVKTNPPVPPAENPPIENPPAPPPTGAPPTAPPGNSFSKEFLDEWQEFKTSIGWLPASKRKPTPEPEPDEPPPAPTKIITDAHSCILCPLCPFPKAKHEAK